MNEQIVYGSHNTMTYLPIKNWWLFPGLLTARCQNNNIGEQFKNGARVFDWNSLIVVLFASMMELVDMRDLNSLGYYSCVGSNPTGGTNHLN